jgi:Family of unknown function (DUF5683)
MPVNKLLTKKTLLFLLTGVACLFFSITVSAQKADSAKKKKPEHPYPWPGRAALYSMINPGMGQAYNKSYWKIPIIYAGLGVAAYYISKDQNYYNLYNSALTTRNNGGIDPYYNIYSTTELTNMVTTYHRDRDWAITAAAGVYLLNILEADIQAQLHHPLTPAGKAMLYSTLVPGLGQIYNKKYWKLPILYAGLGVAVYFIAFNQHYYNLYQDALTDKSNPYYGVYTTAEYAELIDYYHKDRDLSVIIAAGVYLINIVDANVDAQMHGFNVSDDISVNFNPNIFPNPVSGTIAFAPGFTLTKKL